MKGHSRRHITAYLTGVLEASYCVESALLTKKD